MQKIINHYIEKVKDDLEDVCDDATSGAADCLSCFRRQYFDENVISYDCDSKTYIYVARYFPVHIKENAVALNLMPDAVVNRITSENPLNIISIGGGPGCDTFAVKNFLIDSENASKIKSRKDVYLLRIDKEENWNDIAGAVHSRIKDTELIKFNARRNLFDITAKQNWPDDSGRLYNIITMSYFLSERKSTEDIEVVADYINRISSNKFSGILINDRDEDNVHKYKNILFDNLSSTH